MTIPIGTKVKVIKEFMGLKKGSIGILVAEEVSIGYVGIEILSPIPTHFKGHNLGGLVKNGTGWEIPEDHLEIYYNYSWRKL